MTQLALEFTHLVRRGPKLKPSVCRECGSSPREVIFKQGDRRLCRPCHLKATKRWDEEHPEQTKERQHRQRLKASLKRFGGIEGYERAKRERKEKRDALEQSGGYYHRDYAKVQARLLCGYARKRARAEGLPFTITPIDVVIPDLCPVFGIPLKRTPGKQTDASATLDRIVPELGYVPGNVRVISMRANRIKVDGTAEDHERIAAYMRAAQRGASTLSGVSMAEGPRKEN